jgi:hypothetical protein
MSFEFDYSMNVNVGNNAGDDEDAVSDTKNSNSSAADGELTGNESLQELFGELDYAVGELDEAISNAGDGGGKKSSDLTPQDFMSQLNDIADETKGLTDGERKMLDEGKGMINATPQQQQEFLDRAKSLAKDSGEIGDEEAADLGGFADGLMNDAAEGATGADGSDEAEDKPFMDQVEDLLAQSQDGDEGPGEKMAREAAKMLKDNSKEDQQAFLDELEKMLNNTDGNGDHEKDIDETNDGEGTMLKNMAEAFEDLSSDGGESSDGSSGSNSSSNDRSDISSMLLDFIQSESGEGGSEITDAEASLLREVLNNTENSETETA